MRRPSRVYGALALPFLLSGFLTGCLVGPDYLRPETATPDAWHQALVRGLAPGEADLRTWWRALGDPQLDALMERATGGNLDLQEAVGRILEARAALGIATGEFAPDVAATGSEQRSRVSENVAGAIAAPGERVDTLYSVGIDSSWELDVWGRIRRSVESADATYQASIEDYRDVQVSLYADVATNYIEVRTLQARIRYAMGNIETQSKSVKLTEDRLAAGIGSEFEVAQARLNLATTEAFIPQLRIALARSTHRLGVLLGESPSALFAELSLDEPIPRPPDSILVDVPADMVRQRPDVRRAERDLASQTALVGVATADLYPSFSLTGVFALESLLASEWTQRASLSYGFGPAVRWNLFDGGRVRNAIAREDARSEQLYARYEQTTLLALEDVENSMVAYAQESSRRDALARSVEAARKSVELVNTLYRTGLTDFQNVLDMERSRFQQEDALAQSEGLVTQNLIAIYRALGGGWSP